MIKKALIYFLTFLLFFLMPRVVALATDLPASITSQTTIVGTGENVVDPGEAPIIPGLHYTITGPDKLDNGIPIEYVISATYVPSEANAVPLEKLSITDHIPCLSRLFRTCANVVASGTTGNYTVRSDGNINWSLSDPLNIKQTNSDGTKVFEFKITLQSVILNFLAVNKIVVEIAP